MREIPSLQVLCLRAVGSHACSAEVTFAKSKTGEPSTASRLLRSFHDRPVQQDDDDEEPPSGTIVNIPMKLSPCIGKDSARREQPAEVDLNHPIIAYRSKKHNNRLLMRHGKPALDCLQSYIDSLVEMGRMDDARLGVHFFEEWKANVLLGSGSKANTNTLPAPTPPSTRKRRRSSGASSSARNSPLPVPTTPPPLGSLSLHNCAISQDTIEAMVESAMGPNLGVLDMTGMQGLTDDMLQLLLPQCPNITRLSIKNCRRLTAKSLKLVSQHQTKLEFLDIGGSYNIFPQDVLQSIPKLPQLIELQASGLGWTDILLDSLVELRAWKSLGLGFSTYLSANGLRLSLSKSAETLQSLSIPFCESVVDNAMLGILGRNLPNVRFLDLRGNGNLTTVTGWYDGRVSANLPEQELFVLARYSGVSLNSLDETRRIHPLHAAMLSCVLDGGGTAGGLEAC